LCHGFSGLNEGVKDCICKHLAIQSGYVEVPQLVEGKQIYDLPTYGSSCAERSIGAAEYAERDIVQREIRLRGDFYPGVDGVHNLGFRQNYI
jgi:hypothetical protein